MRQNSVGQGQVVDSIWTSSSDIPSTQLAFSSVAPAMPQPRVDAGTTTAPRTRLHLIGPREGATERRAVPFAIPERNHFALTVKRGIDIVGATLLLAMTSPLILILGILIKLESSGPVFFRQIRLGLNGKPFYMLKLRTMYSDAERRKKELMAFNEMSGPAFKMRRDPRITSFGRYLRKYSLDELPQFVNVLIGEMSLVGPRPPLPKEVIRYETWQKRKLSVKPGVTCIWQVNGRNTIDFDEWVRLDLQYIDSWSLWLDIKLLLKTVPAVLKGSGA